MLDFPSGLLPIDRVTIEDDKALQDETQWATGKLKCTSLFLNIFPNIFYIAIFCSNKFDRLRQIPKDCHLEFKLLDCHGKRKNVWP